MSESKNYTLFSLTCSIGPLTMTSPFSAGERPTPADPHEVVTKIASSQQPPSRKGENLGAVSDIYGIHKAPFFS